MLLVLTGCSFARTDKLIDPTIPTESFKAVSLKPVERFIGKFIQPVPESRSTSKFGWRDGRFHEGVDLAASEGSDIVAAHGGEVVMARDDFGRYGKVVAVRSGDMLTVYAHNRRNLVDKGDNVDEGERIAELGSTGNATGPHLHFETRVRIAGRYVAVDPSIFLKRRG